MRTVSLRLPRMKAVCGKTSPNNPFSSVPSSLLHTTPSFPLLLLPPSFQEHFVEVVAGQEFLLLSLGEMERLLSSDDMNVPDEETVVTALLGWVRHDCPARQQYLPSLLAHIRLPLLKPQVRRHCPSPSLSLPPFRCSAFGLSCHRETPTLCIA